MENLEHSEDRLQRVKDLLALRPERDGGLQAAVSYLRTEVAHYDWVGIYLLAGERLRLAAWDGPEATEHTDIGIGEGICGLAARTKQTVLVDDVDVRSEYLACFPATKSEIVVPLISGEECVGEIDVDSDKPSAFGEEDREFLEAVAALLVGAYFK
ncbi:MAG: hypothetical protein B1H03_07095 [Planctomycetales bacterium 4484_113]|nr:MAG: hypothetical protein B1H03_07095 [Planctomycetales bacterium 4484_113]